MDNRERLLLEIKGFNESDEIIGEIDVRLEENGLQSEALYDTSSKSNLKAIYQTALSILEALSNDPNIMKNYKSEDISITHFHTNLLSQIDNLTRKIRAMVDDDSVRENDATWFYMFK